LRELRTQVNRGHPFNKVRNFVRFKACVALFTTVAAPLCSQAADERKLEVFSWWTSGGEAAALNVLFKVYKKQNPGVEIINATVAGGAGFAARPVLQTRLAGGKPPDTWQTHPGQELLDQYVGPGYCEAITELYKSEGWDRVFPKELVVDLLTKDLKIYAVLVGIHRGNILWYNTKLLEKNGIKVGDQLSFDQFFAACDKLKASGIPALGVGDSGIWASAQLFENTLLGVIGPKGWTDLFSGKMHWDNPRVREAMKLFAKMQDYVNPDHSALSWDQAIKALMEGKVAFSSMGDWAYGEFVKAHMKEKEDFGWVCHPYTDDYFVIIADGFTLAKGAPHKEAALAWLKMVGSKEAQEALRSDELFRLSGVETKFPIKCLLTHFSQYRPYKRNCSD